MKTHFDPESNIMMFTVGGGQITHAKEKNGIIIHMTASGMPVLIEMLDASNFITTFSKLSGSAKKIKPSPTPT